MIFSDLQHQLTQTLTLAENMNFGSLHQGAQVGHIYGGHVNVNLSNPVAPAEPTPQPFVAIPFSRNNNFVDRNGISQQLDQIYLQPAARAALVGLGGVGKTQLAIDFCYRAFSDDPSRWIFWVYANSQARVVESFKAIANTVKIAGRDQPEVDIWQLVYDWLANETNGRWVLIVDNADESGTLFDLSEYTHDGRELARYFPQSRNGALLVTTRNKDCARQLTGDPRSLIDVGAMGEEEATNLLQSKLGLSLNPDTATTLVQALDCIPLAISQAGAYIQERTPLITPEDYLSRLQKGETEKKNLLRHIYHDIRGNGGVSTSVITTWMISFEHIRDQRKSAADLLSFMSFFNRQGIPKSLLKPTKFQTLEFDDERPAKSRKGYRTRNLSSGSTNEGPFLMKNSKSTNHRFNKLLAGVGNLNSVSLASSSQNEGSGSQTNLEEYEDGLLEDLKTLQDYSLITVLEDDMFEMHALVQLSTREWLQATNLHDRFARRFITNLSDGFPTGEFETWDKCRILFPHAEEATRHEPTDADTRQKWAYLMHNAGYYACRQSNFAISERMIKAAKSMLELDLGEYHSGTVKAKLVLAYVLFEVHRLEEARELHIQVIKAYEAKLDPDHEDALAAKCSLSAILRKQGKPEEARETQYQLLESCKARLGPDNELTLWVTGQLSHTLSDLGHLDEAHDLQLQVLEGLKVKLGINHPDTLSAMHNLTVILRELDRPDEAHKLQLQVLEGLKVKLGINHPDTLSAMHNLTVILRELDRLDEAHKLQLQVLEGRKVKLGINHQNTLSAMHNLAITLGELDRPDEAHELQLQILEGRKVKLGINHPDTLSAMHNLAITLGKLDRPDEAHELQLQVLEGRKVKLGINHPDTLSAMHNLALIWKAQGRTRDALPLVEDCTQRSQSVLGDSHARSRERLATLERWRNEESRES